MMITPSLAIIAPEDAMPLPSSDEIISEIMSEIKLVKVKLSKPTLTDIEREQLLNYESELVNELECRGVMKMSATEMAQYLGHLNVSDVDPMLFETLIDNQYYDYFIMGPNSDIYNGEYVYFITVEVIPNSPTSLFWTSGTLTLADDSETFDSYSNKVLSTTPSSRETTADDFFSGVGDGGVSYEVEYNMIVTSKFYYVSESESNDELDYTLGLVTTAIDFIEYHILGNEPGEDNDGQTGYYSRTIYDNYYYGAMPYIMNRYYSGRGFEIRCPMDVYYDYDGRTAEMISVQQPFSDPYLYYSYGQRH